MSKSEVAELRTALQEVREALRVALAGKMPGLAKMLITRIDEATKFTTLAQVIEALDNAWYTEHGPGPAIPELHKALRQDVKGGAPLPTQDEIDMLVYGVEKDEEMVAPPAWLQKKFPRLNAAITAVFTED